MEPSKSRMLKTVFFRKNSLRQKGEGGRGGLIIKKIIGESRKREFLLTTQSAYAADSLKLQ